MLELVVPLGLVLGAAVTLLGGGGGVWYLLVLLALDVPYRVAVPTSLATVLLTTTFGSLGHLREDYIAGRIAAVVIAGSAVGTGIGVGVIVGVASAVFGISGTPILLPGLAILGLSATVVVGTSVVAILGTAVAGVAWYERLATVDWSLAVPFGVAAGAGALLAPRLYRLVPDEASLERGYRVVFTLLCLGSGVAFLV